MNFTFIFVAVVVAILVNGLMVLYYHSKWYSSSDDKCLDLGAQLQKIEQEVQTQARMHSATDKDEDMENYFGSRLANYVESSELASYANAEEVHRELAKRDSILAELQKLVQEHRESTTNDDNDEHLKQMHRDVSILQHADIDINNRMSKLQVKLDELQSTVTVDVNEKIKTELPKLKQELQTVHVKLVDACQVLANVLEQNNNLQKSFNKLKESTDPSILGDQLTIRLHEYIDTNLEQVNVQTRSIRALFEEHKKQLTDSSIMDDGAVAKRIKSLSDALDHQRDEYEGKLAEVARSRDEVQEKLNRLDFLGNLNNIRDLAAKLDTEMGFNTRISTINTAIKSIQINHEKWLKRDFKAVGDGVTDDTEAIEAFITHLLKTGDVGLVEAGSFLMSKAVAINSDEEGRPFTIKGLSANASKVTGPGMLTFRDCKNMNIESVTMDRVTMVNCDTCRFENVALDELTISFMSNVQLNNITVDWFALSNVQNARLEHSTIKNLKVVESQKVLLRSIDACNVTYENSNNCTYENSHIMEDGLVTVRDCKLVMFENLFFVGNGFDVFDCKYLTISNVTFVVSSRECIFMQGCEFSKIQNCTMHDAECAIYLQECDNLHINNILVYNQKIPAKVVFQVNKCSFIDCKDLSVNSSDQFDPLTVLVDVVDSDSSTFAFSRIINVRIISIRPNCEDVLVIKPIHEISSVDEHRLDVIGDTNDVCSFMTISRVYKSDSYEREDGRKVTRGMRLIEANEEDTDEAIDPDKPMVLEPMYRRRGSIDDNSERLSAGRGRGSGRPSAVARIDGMKRNGAGRGGSNGEGDSVGKDEEIDTE
nr:DNA repair related ATPase [Heliothis virescens nudivirus]